MKKLFFLLFTFVNLYAVEPVMRMTVTPATIGTNEAAFVELSVQDEPLLEVPVPQKSTGYKLEYNGRGTQSQASMINGTVTVKRFYTYSFRLVPLVPGSYTIPGLKVETKAGSYYGPSAQISIQALAAARAPVNRRGFSPFSSFAEDPGDIFVGWVFSENRVMQNTGVIADLYVISDNPNFLDQFNPALQFKLERQATIDGGVLYEMANPLPQRTNHYVGGVVKEGMLVRRFLVYPLATNSVLYPPVFSLNTGMFPVYVQGATMKLDIIPAPKGLGYIGRELSAKLTLATNFVPAGEDVEMKLVLEGDGNTDYFTDPFSTQKMEGLYLSQPQAKVEVGVYPPGGGSRIYMSKTLTYKISPKKPGAYIIPAIALTYTSPEGLSQTCTTAPLVLEAGEPLLSASSLSKEARALPEPPGGYVYFSGFWYLAAAWFFGSLLMLGSYLYARRRTRLETDETFARRTYSRKRLHAALSAAERAYSEGKHRDAARLLRQSLLGYGADKYGLPAVAAPQELAARLPADLAKAFLALAEELTSAAFGSEPAPSQMEACLAKSEEILSRMDALKA